MQVSIFGLGYVGCVTAACLAELGHTVVGVDAQASKVDALSQGRAPLIEPGLDELIATHVRAGHLRATTNAPEAIHASDIALICVGTPSLANGAANLEFVERVLAEIGDALREHTAPFTVVLRSTCPPGTAEPLRARLCARVGRAVPFAVNPEFLREGSAVSDFFAPPYVLVGADDEATANVLRALYEKIRAEKRVTSLRTAEAVKYASNAFHAVKVVFANELGRWCASQEVDSRAVMELVCADRVLNLSEKYLTPGLAFGGSCLAKDLRALLYQARHSDVELPLLNSVLPSNQLHIQRALDLILAAGKTRVGMLGLAFKAQTDDVRESPLVLLAEQLLGKGFTLTIYDPQLSLTRVMGANRAYLEQHLPHIASLLAPTPQEVLENEVIVVGQRAEQFAALDLRGRIVIDLAGVVTDANASDVRRLV
jgi:GDP-mannose 6-dehydrogenase